MKNYKIHCVTIVKNEVDIIEYTLINALKWADNLFVWDNGSDDGTTEKLNELSNKYEKIHFKGVVNKPFYDGLRGELIQSIKHLSSVGDWWCMLDADEIYFESPKIIIDNQPSNVNCIWGTMIDFKFTDLDYKRYLDDPQNFHKTDLLDRFQYYECICIERRFYKHQKFGLFWVSGKQCPYLHESYSADRPFFANYRYRSPEQIISRVEIRRQLSEKYGIRIFPHEMSKKTYEKMYLGVDINSVDENKDILKDKILDHNDFDLFNINDIKEKSCKYNKEYVICNRYLPSFIWSFYMIIRRKFFI